MHQAPRYVLLVLLELCRLCAQLGIDPPSVEEQKRCARAAQIQQEQQRISRLERDQKRRREEEMERIKREQVSHRKNDEQHFESSTRHSLALLTRNNHHGTQLKAKRSLLVLERALIRINNRFMKYNRDLATMTAICRITCLGKKNLQNIGIKLLTIWSQTQTKISPRAISLQL